MPNVLCSLSAFMADNPYSKTFKNLVNVLDGLDQRVYNMSSVWCVGAICGWIAVYHEIILTGIF